MQVLLRYKDVISPLLVRYPGSVACLLHGVCLLLLCLPLQWRPHVPSHVPDSIVWVSLSAPIKKQPVHPPVAAATAPPARLPPPA